MPGFSGTAELFHSAVWDLLDPAGRTILEISDLAERELAASDLQRDLPDHYWSSHTSDQFAKHHRQSLAAGLRNLSDVRRLGVLATLCAEASAIGEPTVVVSLRDQFDAELQLNPFGLQIIEGPDFGVYLKVLNAIRHPHVIPTDRPEELDTVAFRARQLLFPVMPASP